jgi:hypothetical protein
MPRLQSKFAVLKSFVTFSILFVSSLSWSEGYPLRPDPALTPGQLCQVADTIRYPEKIKYCERNVTTEEKHRIIATYDSKHQFGIRFQDRQQFKIDHYIPLCMGGSNHRLNLWPQHQSIYKRTDPLEQLLCEKMKLGRLKQEAAVNLIRKAKNDLNSVAGIISQVSSL